MEELLSYLKTPTYCENKSPDGLSFVFLFLIYIAATICLGFIMLVTCSILNLKSKEIDLSPALTLFVGIILAPIYEEILFRSLLKFKRINIFLFIITLIGLITFSILKSHTVAIVTLSLILMSFLVILISIKRTHIESFISSKFKYFFYSTIFMFGIIHAFNFTGNTYSILAFSLILGSPQLVMGAILGYIRMKHGLFYSILFHMIINSLIIFSLLGS